MALEPHLLSGYDNEDSQAKSLTQKHVSPAGTAISAVVVVKTVRKKQQQSRQAFCAGILKVGVFKRYRTTTSKPRQAASESVVVVGARCAKTTTSKTLWCAHFL